MKREDLFTLIHKGLRGKLYDLGLILQKNDFLDKASTTDIILYTQSTLSLMDLHAAHEENHIFNELGAFEPEMVKVLEEAHREIERLGAILKSTAAEVEAAQDAEVLLDGGDRMCREFNVYLTFFLNHLSNEEEEAVPACWNHFSDDELRLMRGKIIADTPPEKNAEFMKWMFSSANSNELAESLVGIKASGIPPEALKRMMDLARGIVGEEKWQVILERAGE